MDWNPRFQQSRHRVYVFAGMLDRTLENETSRQKTYDVQWKIHRGLKGKNKRFPGKVEYMNLGKCTCYR